MRNMPGEFVTLGYERWLKTWMTDGEFLDDLMWDLDKNQIDIGELPDQRALTLARGTRDRVSDRYCRSIQCRATTMALVRMREPAKSAGFCRRLRQI